MVSWRAGRAVPDGANRRSHRAFGGGAQLDDRGAAQARCALTDERPLEVGAAEYSRDLDLAVLATDAALPRFSAAMQALDASVIAVPPFEQRFLERGHAVQFKIPDPTIGSPLRVDIMSRMRGVAPFDELWARRTTITLPDDARSADVAVELMALEDLVTAKKTQRDKDWPMLRRLVDASDDSARDENASAAQATFWLSELRSPEFLREAIVRFPLDAARSARPSARRFVGIQPRQTRNSTVWSRSVSVSVAPTYGAGRREPGELADRIGPLDERFCLHDELCLDPCRWY